MKNASTAVINYINALREDPDATAYIADCYTFALTNGLILTYTNADVPITLGGYVFLANSVLVNGLRYKSSTGLEVDQQQLTISANPNYTIGGQPFLQMLGRGIFDGAAVWRARVFLNSWSSADTENPIGSVVLFKGRVGTIDSIGRTTAQITVNSDLVLLDLQMPRNVYSPACQHVLFDSGCTLVKSAYSANGTVASSPGPSVSSVSWTAYPSGVTPGTFTQGTLTFTSGVNNGLTVNIKYDNGTTLLFSYPLYASPAAGDTFTAYWGCDHTQAACQNRFNNLSNFRGFPYVPQPTFTLF